MPLEKEDLNQIIEALSDKFVTADKLGDVIKEQIAPISTAVQRIQETKTPDFTESMNQWIDTLADGDDDDDDDDNLTEEDEAWDEETEYMDDDGDDYEAESVDVEARRANEKLQRELAAIRAEQEKRDEADRQRTEAERIAKRDSAAAKLFEGKVHKGSEQVLVKMLLEQGALQEKDGQLGVVGEDDFGKTFTSLDKVADSFLEKDDYAGFVPPREGGGSGNGATKREAPATQHLTSEVDEQAVYEMIKNNPEANKEMLAELAAMN